MGVSSGRMGIAAVLVSLLTVTGCADVEGAIPGNSYARANPSLAVQTWEATAALALGATPSCDRHDLINTQIVSVAEPLRIAGSRATQGKWTERWTYDMCGSIVPVRVEYQVDDIGVGFSAAIEV